MYGGPAVNEATFSEKDGKSADPASFLEDRELPALAQARAGRPP